MEFNQEQFKSEPTECLDGHFNQVGSCVCGLSSFHFNLKLATKATLCLH